MSKNWEFLGVAELGVANRIRPPTDVFDSGVLVRPSGRNDNPVAVWLYDTENDVAIVSSSKPEVEHLHLVDKVSIGGKADGFRVTVPHQLVSGSEKSSGPLQDL